MPWPWLSAHGGCIGFYYLYMGDVLALAMCFGHGGLAHGCCIEYGYVALPWLLPYKVIMALGACTWTTWLGQRVQSSYFGLGYLPIGRLFSQKIVLF